MMVQLIAVLLVMSRLQFSGIFGFGFRFADHDESFFLKFFDLFFSEISGLWLGIGAAVVFFSLRLDVFLLLFILRPIFSFARVLIFSLLLVTSLLARSVSVVVVFLLLSLSSLSLVFEN
jgi:hypothetical protein